MNEPCPDGKHDLKDVTYVGELLPHMEGFLTSDRWKKVFELTNNIQVHKSLREYLGLDWQTATELAHLCVLGCAYLAEKEKE